MVHDPHRAHERIAELHAVAREVRAADRADALGSDRAADGRITAWRVALGRRVLALGLALAGEAAGPAFRASR